MDIYASAAMAKMGHVLQQQRDGSKQSFVSPKPADMPSMDSVYSSSYYDVTRSDERMRGMKNWKAAEDPWKTGMVPEPAYASMFQPLSSDLPQQPQTPSQPANQPVQTLAGVDVAREDFTHNNMQPYFRGSVRQNTDPMANSSILEHRTGRSDLKQRKQAVECFFEPTAGFSHVCGAPDSGDYARARVTEFTRRANDFPVEQVRVGPGLGQGFTSQADGGFHQGVTRDYVMPKSVDELRVASKPKLLMQTKDPQGPMKGVSQRGLVGSVDKNRPFTYFEQDEDMLLKTTGANLKPKLNPETIMKPTSRVETHVEYQGAPNESASRAGKGESDDFGKDNVMVYKNERDITGTRTVIGNITSYVKAVVAPLMDIFRHNHKEYTLDAARVFGNMQAQIPSKPTTYDPVNHMMRTTVREQLDEAPRLYGNMQAQIPSKPTTYDPVNHIMRTTIKEQLIHDTNVSNPRGQIDAPPVESDDTTRTTNRETLPCIETTVNMSSHTYNVTVYDADAVARTTIRQTTPESSSMYGFVGGDVSESRGAYTHVDVQVPLTQKQFVSDYEYQGTSQSKSDFRQSSREADENAEIDGTREALNLAAGSTPSAGGAYISVTKDQVNMDSKRIMGDSITTRETQNARAVQTAARTIDDCEVTRVVARDVDQTGRIDGDLLSALSYNPYSISINPIQDK